MKECKFEYKIDENDCWNVINLSLNRFGYPQIRIEGRTYNAHRAMYIFNVLNGKSISKSDFVLHSCDNRMCINPDRLRIGTAKDNMNDRIIRNRIGFKLTNQEVEKIRLLSENTPKYKLAYLFNVDVSTINRIVNNKTRNEIL